MLEFVALDDDVDMAVVEEEIGSLLAACMRAVDGFVVNEVNSELHRIQRRLDHSLFLTAYTRPQSTVTVKTHCGALVVFAGQEVVQTAARTDGKGDKRLCTRDISGVHITPSKSSMARHYARANIRA